MAMRSFNMLLILGTGAILALLTSSWVGAELIEPTRSHGEDKTARGTLGILSEPPGQKVMIDGSEFGVTPMFHIEVDAGIHNVKVAEKETQVDVPAGKSVRISLYKGSFLKLPEVKEIAVKPRKEPEAPKTKSQNNQPQTGDDSIRYEPLYWPLNPKGPIY